MPWTHGYDGFAFHFPGPFCWVISLLGYSQDLKVELVEFVEFERPFFGISKVQTGASDPCLFTFDPEVIFFQWLLFRLEHIVYIFSNPSDDFFRKPSVPRLLAFKTSAVSLSLLMTSFILQLRNFLISYKYSSIYSVSDLDISNSLWNKFRNSILICVM